MEHPVIKLFEGAAELLDIQQDKTDPDEAMIRLAAWMDLANDHLTVDDQTVLVGIGALLYRDGLARRMS